MIAKRIPRTKGTSSASRLVKYMVAAKGGLDPESWKRTADYILDSQGTTTQGEKVASYRVTNCGTDDPAQATQIIEAIQAANTRSKSDKTYHLVFSFPPGEEPPLELLHRIEDELCAAIGLGDHQRISAVHQDTDHLHVHVCINKVHPTGLQNIEPHYDKQKLMEACERLEIQYGLTRTNHGLTEGKAYDRRERIRLGPEREHNTAFREFLRESYDIAIAGRPEAQSYDDLRTLSGGSVAHGVKGYPELLSDHARNRLDQERSETIDGLRRPGNGNGAVGGSTRKVKGAAAEMEALAGVETLTGYVAREVAPAMRQAANWQELHDALAEHGLQLKQRGAGLVIGDAGLDLWCKASSAGRDLSAKALTDRLGPFERDQLQHGGHGGDLVASGDPARADEQAAGGQGHSEAESGQSRWQGDSQAKPGQSRWQRAAGQERAGGKGYTARPLHQHPSSAGLYAEYQKERAIALAARRGGSKAISDEAARRREELRVWGIQQRALIKASPRGPGKKMMFAQTQAQITSQREAIANDAATKRHALHRAPGHPSWNDWLSNRAERGDVDALAILRSRAERGGKMRGDLLTAERADKAKTVILDNLKAAANKDGVMSYRTADGGLVLDRSSHVQAKQATAGAAFVALSLAAKRFEGQALDVRGSDQFRSDVAELAGFHGINVTFADPMLEKVRAEALARRQDADLQPAKASAGRHRGADRDRSQSTNGQRPSGAQEGRKGAGQGNAAGARATASSAPENARGGREPAATAAVMEFIEKRNSQRDKISSIDYIRLWSPKDAGSATYQGRRKMKDGTEVLLLKRGDEMLVKPSTANVVAKASQWPIGSRVNLDARGRFISNDMGHEL